MPPNAQVNIKYHYVFWCMLPGVRHYGLSFAWHTSNKIDVSSLAGHLSEIMNFDARLDPGEAALARYLRDQLGTQGQNGRLSVDPIICGDPEQAPPAALPPHLPLARHFEKSGMIFMRSGNGPNDTYALFNTAGHHSFSSYPSTPVRERTSNIIRRRRPITAC